VKLRFSNEDWARVAETWSAWWEGKLARPLIFVTRWEGPVARNFTAHYGLDTPVDDVLDEYEAQIEGMRWYGDAFPKLWINFGPGILAGFLGGSVEWDENTVWFGPAGGVEKPIEEIRPVYDPDNPWWQRVLAITRRAVERFGDQVCVSHTDLGGNLDIIASLRGTQNLLMDFYDAPEEVDRLVGDVTRLWLRYYDELYAILKKAGRGTTPWAPIWSPGRTYMLQSDFCYMIGPDMFRQFVLPDLEACCAHLDHGFYHLDGPGQLPHLDMLLAMKDLHGVQWIPGDGNPPAAHWPQVLRRIVAAGKRCQVYTDADGARRILREVGGRGMVIQVRELPGHEDTVKLVRELVTC